MGKDYKTYYEGPGDIGTMILALILLFGVILIFGIIELFIAS